MFHKFSVLLKLPKFFNFKSHGLAHMLNCEYTSTISKHRSITKNQKNVISIPERFNNLPIAAKNHTCFKIERHMSTANNEGSGQEPGGNDNTKKFVKMRKNLFFRGRSKFRKSRKPHINCTRCKTLPMDLNKKNVNNVTVLAKDKKDNESPKVLKTVAQSQLPAKKVHVEFMESQNLKDFNLNKTPQTHANIKSVNGTSLKDQTASSVKATDFKKDLINLESQDLKKSNTDFQNKQMLKDQVSLKDVSKNKNSNEVSKKSGNIRILYQAHPRRKTKIKIPKDKQSQKLPQTIFVQQQEQGQAVEKTSEEKTHLLTGKDTQTKSFSNEVSTKNDESIKTLYQDLPRKNSEESKQITQIKIEEQQKQSSKALSKWKKYRQSVKHTEIKGSDSAKPPTNKNTDTTKLTVPSNTTDKILACATFPNIEVTMRPNTQVRNAVKVNENTVKSLQVNKDALKSSIKSYVDSGNSVDKSPSADLESLKNYFGEYIFPEKRNPNIKTNAHDAQLLPKDKYTKQGFTILKTNKLTKSKRARRAGRFGNSSSGDGGGKETGSTNARPLGFWRTVSVTILPFILVLTVYAISNISAVEMFKRMRYMRSIEDPVSKETIPIFYGKSSIINQLHLKESESGDEDDSE